MTPVMAAGVEASQGGYVADLENGAAPLNPPASGKITLDSPGWDRQRIQAPEAWEMGLTGRSVPVAVLDTGIDADHEALKGKVIAQTSFADGTEADTQRGHGTHVAGIIAASAGDRGTAGLAFGSQLLDVRVAENDGTTDAQKLARGMIWAVDHGARILNVSIVIDRTYAMLEYAADYAWNRGCIVVAAAGNSPSSEPVYPAAYAHVIAVGATDGNDHLAAWSNRGSWVSLNAPGVSIYSTLPGNRYGTKNGSSYSAALVSGEAALLYGEAQDLGLSGQLNSIVASFLLANCDGLDDYSGKRINAFKAASALEAARDSHIPAN